MEFDQATRFCERTAVGERNLEPTKILIIRMFQNLTCFIVFGDGCQMYHKIARVLSILKFLTLTENDNLKS